MIYIIIILIKILCLVVVGGVVPDETTPIRIAMLHRRMKVISQKKSSAGLY